MHKVKKIYYQEESYVYSSIDEAEEHLKEMTNQGWSAKVQGVYAGKFEKSVYIRKIEYDNIEFVIEFYKHIKG